jgi:streptogramin lyase
VPGRIVQVDPSTGAETTLFAGAGPFDGPQGDTSVAVEPSGDILFLGKMGTSLEDYFGVPGLYRLDPATGAVSLLDGQHDFSTDSVAVSADGRVIVALAAVPDPGRIVQVDPSTGAETTLFAGAAGTFEGPWPVASVAVEPSGDILFYGMVDSSLDHNGEFGLDRLDPATGAVSLLDGSQGLDGVFAIGADGRVIAANSPYYPPGTFYPDIVPGRIAQVDPSTGAETPLLDTGDTRVIASVAVEPSGDILFIGSLPGSSLDDPGLPLSK